MLFSSVCSSQDDSNLLGLVNWWCLYPVKHLSRIGQPQTTPNSSTITSVSFSTHPLQIRSAALSSPDSIAAPLSSSASTASTTTQSAIILAPHRPWQVSLCQPAAAAAAAAPAAAAASEEGYAGSGHRGMPEPDRCSGPEHGREGQGYGRGQGCEESLGVEPDLSSVVQTQRNLYMQGHGRGRRRLGGLGGPSSPPSFCDTSNGERPPPAPPPPPLHVINPASVSALAEASWRMSFAEMKSLITEYALALVLNDDPARARALELALASASSIAGDAVQRLGALFLPLLKRQNELQATCYRTFDEYVKDVRASATVYFDTVPYFKFVAIVALSTFTDVLMPRCRMHLVGVGPAFMGVWQPLFRALHKRDIGIPEAVRITTMSPAFSSRTQVNPEAHLEAAKAGRSILRQIALQMGIKSFEHRQVTLTQEVMKDMTTVMGTNERTGQPWMEREDGEALVVFLPYIMHMFPHSPGVEGSPLYFLLQWLASIKPDLVVVLDYDWDTASTFFLSRLQSSLDFVGAAFDLNDEIGGKEKRPHVVVMEDMTTGQLAVQALQPYEEIRVMPRTADMWAREFARCGLRPAPGLPRVFGALQSMLEGERLHPAITVFPHRSLDNTLQQCWKGQSMVFASLWTS